MKRFTSLSTAFGRRELRHLRLRARRLRPVLNDRFPHGHAPPVRPGPINLVLAPLGLGPASYVFRGLLNQLLGQVHYAAIVGISLVELEHGELRIPPPPQPFVAEVAIDFVHPVKSAHGQSLQIQLRRDAQKQIHVERVVMRDKRPRHRPARDGLHHRRFHFDKSLRSP